MLTWDEYLAHPAINASRLLHMAKSAAQYRWIEQGGEQPDKPVLKTGRLIHCATLEPDRFAAEYVVRPTGCSDRRTKAYKEWRETLPVELNDVAVDDHAQAVNVSLAVRNHPAASRYLTEDGVAEATVLWTHRSGLACKLRADWLDAGAGLIVDLKTARSASEFDFGKAAARLDYPTRCAFYVDGVRSALGFDPTMVLIAAEKEPPYHVAVYRVGEDVLEYGRRRYEDLLARVKYCRERDTWPGLNDDQERELWLPEWFYGGDDGLDLDFGEEGVLRA